MRRFTQKDIIHFTNRYIYVANNPINFYDPLGLINFKDVFGKIFTSPNTALGLIIGGTSGILNLVGTCFGAWGNAPEISLGNNAIQINLHTPFPVGGAITFGNTIIYNNACPTDRAPAYDKSLPDVLIGLHEMCHTLQYQRYGIFFLSIYIGTGAMIDTSFSSHSFLEVEADIYSLSNESPWYKYE
jgi:hypothetical protein